jgi:hypothetical protein
MASASSRVKTFARAVGLGTSLTLMGKAIVKGVERASHGFRSVAPWRVPVVDVGAWLQRAAPVVSMDGKRPEGLRSFKIRDGSVVAASFENRADRLKSSKYRNGRVVEVVLSFD